jgi:hypothetical protein
LLRKTEKASVLSRIPALRKIPRGGWNSDIEAAFLSHPKFQSGFLPMPLTAEQHASIAASYDKAASDLLVPEALRAEFAKKADWFRKLGWLETKREAARQTPEPSIPHTLPAPEDNRESSPKYLLASLWLIAAVLYTTGALLFAIAVNLPEKDAKSTTISKNLSAPSNPRQSQLETKQPVIADRPQRPAMAPPPAVAAAMVDRRHAISPDEPSYESPALAVPPSPAKEDPPPPQRRYADLPHDEEVFLEEPRPGFLARRHMMREGLMSPGFLPPR